MGSSSLEDGFCRRGPDLFLELRRQPKPCITNLASVQDVGSSGRLVRNDPTLALDRLALRLDQGALVIQFECSAGEIFHGAHGLTMEPIRKALALGTQKA